MSTTETTLSSKSQFVKVNHYRPMYRFNMEPWLNSNSKLKRARKMTCVKPFKWRCFLWVFFFMCMNWLCVMDEYPISYYKSDKKWEQVYLCAYYKVCYLTFLWYTTHLYSDIRSPREFLRNIFGYLRALSSIILSSVSLSVLLPVPMTSNFLWNLAAIPIGLLVAWLSSSSLSDSEPDILDIFPGNIHINLLHLIWIQLFHSTCYIFILWT